MELSDNLIYTAMQRLAVIHYQKILYADLTDDLYFVLKANEKEWNMMLTESNSRKLSEWFIFFANSPLCHDDDREKFSNFTNINNLKRTFEQNNNQPIRISYRRKFVATDVDYHSVKLEFIPDIDKNGHLIAFMFVNEVTVDDRTYRATLQTIKEDKKLIQHSTKIGKRKILVVEDNEFNRKILKNILIDEYDVVEAESGLIGLEILADNYRDISAVLLDLFMPIVDGFEFLEKINKDSILSSVPIIVTTTSNMSEDEEKCLHLGAVDFITKPFNPQIVKMRLKSIIKLKENSATLSAIEFDDVTGLYTRAAFYHHAEKMLKTHPDNSYDLLISTIDNYRNIIEQYGDSIGKQVISYIGKNLRPKDKDVLMARLRDEIFVNILPHNDNFTDESIIGFTENMMKNAPVSIINSKFAIYRNVDKSLSISTLIERTLSALETIKHQFGKTIVHYDEKIIEQQEKEAAMESSFDSAIANNEFEVWFQPKYDTFSKTITGAEALIRWRGDGGLLIPPGDFIPLFERDGLIRSLDEYVFYNVCQFQGKRLSEGKKIVPISVNLSRASMYNSDIAEKYTDVLKKFQISTDLVPIEITESAALTSNSVRNFAETLNRSGFLLHMDDFGSGYSSLASLQILKFDTIKLDKTLIDFIGTPSGESLLRHTIAFAKESGLNVVAEGVENEKQLQFLQETKCDSIQGFYFSRPLQQKDFIELLEK